MRSWIPSPEDTDHVRLLEFYLRRLNYLLNQATRQYLARYGLSLPRFGVLVTLYHMDNITMGDLQKHLYLAPSTLTGLVDGLVEARLVTRERDIQDRRVVRLCLAPAGREKLEHVLAYKRELLARATEHLVPGELEKINEELRSIYLSLEKELEEA